MIFIQYDKTLLSFCDTLGKQSCDEELNAFIDKAGDTDEELPMKQRSAKLKKEDLTYHKYLKDHCFEGLYAFQVR